MHSRADRPRRPPLAAGSHGEGRNGPDDREPRVRPVRTNYVEITPLILSSVLGLLMAFIAHRRIVMTPIF